MKKQEDERRPRANTSNTDTKSIVFVNGKVLVLFVFVSLSAMVFLSYFPSRTSSLKNNDGSEDGLLLPIAKEELEEVLKEEER